MSKLYLITGFLGAGKTTFLKNFIRHFANQRMHVIVNEFGKEGIDGQILATLGAVLDEINNGSIFCACRLDKFEEVLQNALETEPDVIIVEASGLSNPTNIRKILAQEGKFPSVEYMGSICLIDAKQFRKVYDTATVVKKQIAVSELLLINKSELVPPEEVESIRQLLLSHSPNITVHATSFGKFEPQWIEALRTREDWDGDAVMQRKDITLRSFVLTLKETFTLYQLQKFMEMFLTDTYRVKGFVSLEGQVYLVDCVGNMFKAEPFEGTPRGLNQLVILSAAGLPAQRAVKEAIKFYEDQVVEFTS